MKGVGIMPTPFVLYALQREGRVFDPRLLRSRCGLCSGFDYSCGSFECEQTVLFVSAHEKGSGKRGFGEAIFVCVSLREPAPRAPRSTTNKRGYL